MANKSLLDVYVHKVLEQVTAKYGLKLPKKVITIDYGDDVGDLYVRFHHADNTEGLATLLRKLSFTTQRKVYLSWKKHSG